MKYILLFLLLLLPSGVFALSCEYDTNPFILSSRPVALCTVLNENNSRCYTYLSEPGNNSNVWGGLPDGKTVEGVGRIDYFLVNGHNAVVELSRSRLYNNIGVTGNVVCGDEFYSFNFTPSFADYQEVGELYLFGIANAPYIIFGILIFLFLLVGVMIIKDW